jgi:hypothetical protein
LLIVTGFAIYPELTEDIGALAHDAANVHI